jgi:arsenate reductase
MLSELRRRVLFVDPSHGARSQMAAALLGAAAKDRFEAASAGTEPGGSLDLVPEALAEVGIRDFSPERGAIAELGSPPDLLVVVCEEGCDRCPYVPGARRVLRWPQPDPDTAPPGERMGVLRRIRGDVQLRITYLVSLPESWTVSSP